MGLIFARVACRSPQWVLAVCRCVTTGESHITVGLNFVPVLSLALITSTYLGHVSSRLAASRLIKSRSSYAGRERFWVFDGASESRNALR